MQWNVLTSRLRAQKRKGPARESQPSGVQPVESY
jgi:hypothetical protein